MEIKPVRFVFMKAVKGVGKRQYIQKMLRKPQTAFTKIDTSIQPMKYQSA